MLRFIILCGIKLARVVDITITQAKLNLLTYSDGVNEQVIYLLVEGVFWKKWEKCFRISIDF